jgi:hypothetical protein
LPRQEIVLKVILTRDASVENALLLLLR